MNEPKPHYPEATVYYDTTGESGNSFVIIARTVHALELCGAPSREIGAFMEDVTAGDRDHLINVVGAWVHLVEWDESGFRIEQKED